MDTKPSSHAVLERYSRFEDAEHDLGVLLEAGLQASIHENPPDVEAGPSCYLLEVLESESERAFEILTLYWETDEDYLV